MPRTGIPTGITASDVHEAVAKLRRNGLPATFSPHTDFVLVIEGEWFPPKAVVAQAAERVAGRVLSSSDFSGGDGPGQANRVLRRLGFEVIRRKADGVVIDPVVRWCRHVGATRRAVVDGETSAHQPTTLLYFLALFTSGAPRFTPWNVIKRELGNFLGAAGGDKTPQYPLRVLSREGVLAADALGPLESEQRWTLGGLDSQNPSFGLPDDLYVELGSNPDRVSEVVAFLGTLFANPNQFDAVRTAIGVIDSATNFGEVPGIRPGATFVSREEVRVAGLHKHGMRGISTSEGVGANAIVISGGYPDDEDHGDWFIYTGDGGRDPNTKQQVADQTLTIGNQGLIWSYEKQLPVRVIRGSGGDPAHSPASGYRYDGLYRITRYWTDRAEDGFLRFHFQFERDAVEDARPAPQQQLTVPLMPSGQERPERRPRTSSQIVRDSKVKDWVKKLYNFECQVCGHVIETRNGRLAEAAHIVPLGDPHGGPDIVENVLCLCPNHHRAFDAGVWFINDEWQVVETTTNRIFGALKVNGAHGLRVEFARTHRNIRRAG